MGTERLNLENRHVVITGASSGLGEAVAMEMAAHGAYITLLARRQERLDAVAQRIADRGGNALPLTADVTCKDDVNAAISRAVDQWGPVDILVANAGVSPNMKASELDVQLVENTMQINFFGVIYAMNAVLPAMLKRREGVVLTISSVAAFRGLPTMGPYCASKAAVSSWMESLRSELDFQKTGVRLITSHPGFIDTPMIDSEKTPKPFLVDVNEAARLLVQGMIKGKSEINFPWQLVTIMKFAQRLPNRLFDRAVIGSVTNPVTWTAAAGDAVLWVSGALVAWGLFRFTLRTVSPPTAETLTLLGRVAVPLLVTGVLIVSKRLRGSIKIPILIVIVSVMLAACTGLAKLAGLL
ncbi:MAG: SDR family NAD(P)-dependent oxidoreductase [Fuerstiella sp.]|nr:SDR family NAD(P)-dependent oxidoreductase [Fuerstiella sp.]